MPDALREKLSAAVGPANVLTGIELSPYVVEGRTPDAAVFPGSIDEVAAVVGLAANEGVPVTPWGGGAAASVGMPAARAGLVLGLRRMSRLLEHEPADLTATVEAGMTMGAFQAALGGRGQWMSLDPADADRATVGGVLATNAFGPRRHLYGAARDLLIGVTVVTADGAVVRGGGKVVKNVAGYDLPKLFVGSYGTLGVIVEATVKLRPLPDHEHLLAVRFERLKDTDVGVKAIMGSDLIPSAIELLDATAASSAGLAADTPAGGAVLVVGFDGPREQVAWQCAELARILVPLGGRPTRTLEADAWSRLAAAPGTARPATAAVMTFSVVPSLVAETMDRGAGIARARGLHSTWAAHAGVGAVRAVLASDAAPHEPAAIATVLGEWREMARAGGGHATLAWAPLAVKSRVPVWDEPGAAGRIMQRIKSQLDPGNILNPGRFIAGI